MENYGEILRRTRKQANLTQQEIAEKISCHRSDISKLEHDNMGLSAETMLEWLAIVNRVDILILLLNGFDTKKILKIAFTEKYLEKLSQIELPPVSLEQLRENFKNADKILKDL
ncbi:helix-turn-helix domain-containing protein [Oceanobacillus salinisoli]|uniref:helix-turn-helix domain-containing protein n=1 Tax=Oceanobacillus salinisoli TaxID=2678611 RepID=UPI0018CC6424|nr:helix-turn-helix transcriptional regulator [Oceanobacillus salinisoli]